MHVRIRAKPAVEVVPWSSPLLVLVCACGQLRQAVEYEAGPLALGCGPKCGLEWLGGEQIVAHLQKCKMRSVTHALLLTLARAHLLPLVLCLWVFQQLQRELLLTQQHCVCIIDLRCHLAAKVLQLFLPDHSGVAEPPAIRLDAGAGQLLGLQILQSGENSAGGAERDHQF